MAPVQISNYGVNTFQCDCNCLFVTSYHVLMVRIGTHVRSHVRSTHGYVCEEKQMKGRHSVFTVRHGFRCSNGLLTSVACAELCATALRDDGYHVICDHTESMCGCPRTCKALADAEDDPKGWTQEKKLFMQYSWAADGHAALMLASRLWASTSV